MQPDRKPSAYLSFVATSALLRMGWGEDEFSRPVLSFRVQLATGKYITLSSGVRLHEIKGEMDFYAEDGDPHEGPKVLGGLRYLERMELLSAELALPTSHFNELLSAAKIGRMPSHIGIRVEGLEYESQFVSELMKWDDEAFPKLSVTSAAFRIDL